MVVATLAVALPVVVVAERLRVGAGRAVALSVVRGLSRACGIRYEVIGKDRLERSRAYVLVPNHASPADIPALLVAAPDVRFVAAAELFRVPLLGAAMRSLGAIPVDRARPTRDGGRLTAPLDEGASVVVFAEGGIPEPGEHRRFTSGAFVLAIESGAPVVPVTITGTAAVLPRGQKIWVRPGLVTVEIHPPIETTGLTIRDRKRLRDDTERAVRAETG